MAFDFVFVWLLVPAHLATALLAMLAVFARPSKPGTGILNIGIKRLACGYLGALVATLLYSVAIGGDKFPLLYILIAPLVIVIITVIGLPLFALVSKFGFSSLFGVLLIALICSVAYSAYSLITFEPYNIWCHANEAACMARSPIYFTFAAILIALGFGLGARLPVVK